jgi:glycosyltransferase involved in cell wall biosynthesis
MKDAIIFDESCYRFIDLEEPKFSRQESVCYSIAPDDSERSEEALFKQVEGFLHRLNECYEGSWPSWLLPHQGKVPSIADLIRLGLPEEVIDELNGFVAEGADEKIVVTIFLYQLSREEEIKESLSRAALRVISKSFKQLPAVSEDLRSKI